MAKSKINWRKVDGVIDELDPDDEPLDVTPGDVTNVLGFDPLELTVNASDCGAGVVGAPGFQRGNTCAADDGPSSSIVNTPAFKKWFRKSKVVNDDGSPRVVYHGTMADTDFNEFKIPEGEFHTLDQKLGIHFADDPTLSEDFTTISSWWNSETGEREPVYGEKGRIYPVYLSIQNPLQIEQRDLPGGLEHDAYAIDRDIFRRAIAPNKELFSSLIAETRNVDLAEAQEIYDRVKRGESIGRHEYNGVVGMDLSKSSEPLTDYADNYFGSLNFMDDAGHRRIISDYKAALRKAGYDGIVYTNTAPMETGETSQRSWIVLDPKQIKSASGNRGTFDPNDPNVTNSDCGAGTPGAPGFQKGNTCAADDVPPHYAGVVTDRSKAAEIKRQFDKLNKEIQRQLQSSRNPYTWFHGTVDTALESIREKGLIPKGGKGGDSWLVKTNKPMDALPKAMIADREASVFIASDPNVAGMFANVAKEMNPNGVPVVLPITIPTEENGGIRIDELSGQYRFKGTIKPEWIDFDNVGVMLSTQKMTVPPIRNESDIPRTFYAVIICDPQAVTNARDCGANAPGGGGFQPGNTCAVSDSGSKATVNFHPGQERFLNDAGKKLFGEDYEKSDWAKIVGVDHLEDTIVKVRSMYDGEHIQINMDSPKFTAGRNIMNPWNAPYIYNDTLDVYDEYQKQGLGTSIFSSQVEFAREHGFSHITTYGARGTDGNVVGYYVWPLLGYDGELDSGRFFDKEAKALYKSKFNSPASIQELLSKPGGREFWKQYGEGMSYRFDLDEDSTSSRVLNNYLKSRGHTRNAKAKSGSGRIGLSLQEIERAEKAIDEYYSLTTNASDCGANAPGGGGFQKGNTCAVDDKSSIADTTAFRKWFGDSRVVDSKGNPKLVYHGTDKHFDEFDNPYSPDPNWNMFSENPEYSGKFASLEGGNIKPVYLRVENPFDLTHIPARGSDARVKVLRAARRAGLDHELLSKHLPYASNLFQIIHGGQHHKVFADQLRSQGFDGIKFNDPHGDVEAITWVTLDSRQVKSSFNKGTFDPDDPNILNKDCGANAPGGGGFQKGNTCAAGDDGPDDPQKAKAPSDEEKAQAARKKRRLELAAEAFKGKRANSQGHDTQELYRNHDGTWTKEREALHNKIIESHFKNKSPVEHPTAFMTGGGPASGKSAAMELGFVNVPKNTVTIDSDHIKSMLPEYGALQNDDTEWTAAAAFVHEESSYLSKEIMRRSADGSYNTLLDGTGDSSIESLRRKVAAIKTRAVSVQSVYVTVDTDEAVARAISRAEKTRRYVPESVLRKTHALVSQALPKALDAGLYDRVALYDTSTRPPKLVMSKESGQEHKIHEPELWDSFIAKGND